MATEIDPTSFSAANRNALKSAIESLLSEKSSDTETLTEQIMSYIENSEGSNKLEGLSKLNNCPKIFIFSIS